MAEVPEVTPKMEISGYAGTRSTAVKAVQAAHYQPMADKGPAASLEAQVKNQAEAANSFLQRMNVRLRFNVDANSNSVLIMIVDTVNGEVIRTVPPEYFMKATQAVTQKGIILDEDV